MFRSKKSILFSSVAVLTLTTLQANAGGFALREQSAYGQGSSFAGIAAGGALSSMFWNPAAMTQFNGKTIEMDAAGILPSVSHSYTRSDLTTATGGLFGYANSVSNSGDNALLPAMYASWQLTPQLWAGLSVNSPFGLSVSFPQAWAGAGYAQSTSVKSYNASPSIAYKINDMFSIAVGVQVQYLTASYGGLANPVPVIPATISGNGYAYGYTLGTTITPTAMTKIGIGYRSALNQKIDGTLVVSGVSTTAVSTTVPLPGLLSVGLRQGITDRFTLLGEFEWQNWSRIGTPNVMTSTGAVATRLPFEYSDGWFYSLGGEYAVDPLLKLRAGIAFEKSPITDQVRTPRLPDNDRMWYSVGATYKHPQFTGLTFDLGYSYIKAKDTPINVGPGNPSATPAPPAGFGVYTGSVTSSVNIFSVAMRYQWDNAAAPAPMHQRYTK
jgi:long-chain fatty acid transport protein